MKRTIARWYRRQLRRDSWTPFAESRRDAVGQRFTAAGRDAGELFTKSWHSQIFDGMASATPAVPNAGALVREQGATWWRRLLRKLGR